MIPRSAKRWTGQCFYMEQRVAEEQSRAYYWRSTCSFRWWFWWLIKYRMLLLGSQIIQVWRYFCFGKGPPPLPVVPHWSMRRRTSREALNLMVSEQWRVLATRQRQLKIALDGKTHFKFYLLFILCHEPVDGVDVSIPVFPEVDFSILANPLGKRFGSGYSESCRQRQKWNIVWRHIAMWQSLWRYFSF